MNRKSLLICGTGISLTLGLVLLLGSVVWVQAAPGDLDPTFGTWGRATTAFEEAVTSSGYGVAVQADGKMVLVGTAEGSYTDGFGIVRLNPNGTQDPSFSDDGMTI